MQRGQAESDVCRSRHGLPDRTRRARGWVVALALLPVIASGATPAAGPAVGSGAKDWLRS